MKILSSSINLKNLCFYAFHGVADQERCIGNEFVINLKLKANISRAIITDDVTDTISYADVYESIKEEMAIPSRLLEHICGRIVKRLFNDYPAIDDIEIELMKRNPPMGADIESAGIEMHCRRDEQDSIDRK